MTDLIQSQKSKGGTETILGGRSAVSPAADAIGNAIGGTGMGGEKKKKKSGAPINTLGGIAEQLGGA